MRNIKIYGPGIALTLGLAAVAKGLSYLPFMSIMGPLVIAITLGMVWRAVWGNQEALQRGVAFSGKKLLRAGIVLLGARLNLADIYRAGFGVFMAAVLDLTFALAVVYGLTRLFHVDRKLGLLTACGTAICGAAAVVAIAPQIEADEEETAVGAATVAVLGTLFTMVYTALYAVMDLSPRGYGIWAGGTLHEIAHVVAAAAVGGEKAVDVAVIVKLTRVALLVPVSLIAGAMYRKKAKPGHSEGGRSFLATLPWFILGFLAVSGCVTLGAIPAAWTPWLVNAAYLLLGMAMAGLGLGVEFKAFRRKGMRAFSAGLIGSLLLSAAGYGLVLVLHLG
ncbi:YeiH family protein [Paenibacillus sp. NFR01]|uniref:YeiH family protein n=1 Tax=Paenibacillus sp. NFR01 TaxID=1566279 RepID=UPI0008C981C5|nr:YeiH family protein [Paenibacillus sp. NFR01]SEU10460.1 conserved hypothetical integral membrane protein [Paenibacillus sp. NFR01]